VAYANSSTTNVQISSGGALIAASHSIWNNSTSVPGDGIGKNTDIYVSCSTGHIILSTPSSKGTQALSLGVGTTPGGTAGEIRATNNITAYYSDDRLKTRLGVVENALDKVSTLDAFYYEANELAQSLGYKPVREVGISAQQVEEIMPEVVAPAPIDDRFLTVRYERLVPLLIEAIKELNTSVKTLQTEIEVMKRDT
jgi:hypothetical protein